LKKEKRPNRCNVLEATPLGKQLWQFSPDGGRPKVEEKVTVAPNKPIPRKLGRKTWRDLFQPRLNVAWLPADQVFLRVVQMPQAEAGEIGSMLEFQLEKISPLPVAQIVWSFELIPSREINNITAVVIIVARDLVEERIGAIEQGGYQPDRLELPHIYQLVAEVPETDGVWIYPWTENSREFCIATWWFTGTMRHIQLINLPTGPDRERIVREQLMETAWAGEMEGWLNFPVRWRVVAPADNSAEWQKSLQTWVDGPVDVLEQMPADRLAQFSAARAFKAEPSANLLPTEFAVRYRQQFIDRIWMRGLLALAGVYVVAVLAYFFAVQWEKVKTHNVERRIAGIAQTYTNTLRLKERVQVLQDQQALKYAALDCWKAASDLLPTELTLTTLSFGKGQTVILRGTAENFKALATYNDAMRNYTVGGERLFKTVTPPTSSSGAGGVLNWDFTCEVNRPEVK
jgi:Tfp pilus assembly protein PilN